MTCELSTSGADAPGADNAAPLVSVIIPHYTTSPTSHPTAVEAFEKVFAFNFKRYIEEVGFSGSGNMLASREIFDSVGGFLNELAEGVDWG
jgi:hypothetical protein